jgi:hypothetical protein
LDLHIPADTRFRSIRATTATDSALPFLAELLRPGCEMTDWSLFYLSSSGVPSAERITSKKNANPLAEHASIVTTKTKRFAG